MADVDAGLRGWSRYPHIVLRDDDYLWTSVHVALIKSRQTAAEWRPRAPRLPPRITFPRRVNKHVLEPLARLRSRRSGSRGS